MYELLSLSPGESLWVSVLSGSMAPLCLPGDEVRITVLGQGEIPLLVKPGTVVLFYEEGRFYFHRILRMSQRRKRVYQKGDANREGSWVGFERILGVVTEGRRRGEPGFTLHVDRRGSFFMRSYCRIRIGQMKEKIKKGIKRCLFMN